MFLFNPQVIFHLLVFFIVVFLLIVEAVKLVLFLISTSLGNVVSGYFLWRICTEKKKGMKQFFEVPEIYLLSLYFNGGIKVHAILIRYR